MIRVLDNNARTEVKYALTGDESWMNCNQSPKKIWVSNGDFVDQKIYPTNYQ
jgi:hypothetical protein